MDQRQIPGRPSRPQQAPRVATTQAARPTTTNIPPATISPLRPAPRRRWPLIAGAAFALLLLITVAAFFLNSGGPRTDRYQMVYMDDGKVFFGKLKNTHGDYLRLEKAYSVRSADLPSDATEEQRQAAGGNVSLVKVSELVYGPENIMMIRAEKVNFWQDLKKDSKVTKAIDEAEKK